MNVQQLQSEGTLLPPPCLQLTSYPQVRYIGVSNETSYGVSEFSRIAQAAGLPKIVSIQNSYSLLVRASGLAGLGTHEGRHPSRHPHCSWTKCLLAIAMIHNGDRLPPPPPSGPNAVRD